MTVEQLHPAEAEGGPGRLGSIACAIPGTTHACSWEEAVESISAGPQLARRVKSGRNSRAGKSLDNNWNSLLNSSKAGLDADRDRLFELLLVRLVTICQYRLRGWPSEEIEDIVQDSLAIVFEKLATVNDNPHYFALAVLENRIGGVLRQKRRRTMISLNPTGTLGEQDDVQGADMQLPSESYDEMLDHLHESDLSDKLLRALRKLSPLCQAIFLALLKYRAVAEVWEEYQEREPKLSRNAFDKRLFDCRKKLRELTGGQLA